jgi:hypothetical protein
VYVRGDHEVITVPDRAVSQAVKSIRDREARGVPDRPLRNSTERSRHGRLVRVRRSRWRCVGVFGVSEWKWIHWVQWLWDEDGALLVPLLLVECISIQAEATLPPCIPHTCPDCPSDPKPNNPHRKGTQPLGFQIARSSTLATVETLS